MKFNGDVVSNHHDSHDTPREKFLHDDVIEPGKERFLDDSHDSSMTTLDQVARVDNVVYKLPGIEVRVGSIASNSLEKNNIVAFK